MELEEFVSLPPTQVRNFCMVAHVDHGKTTLSDFLLTANGLLSRQLAGKVRFLDSRPDEQERLITMKASCVALRHMQGNQRHLVHLVDSPGHIDFSSEVSTAMRMCDGALIVVDVIDGVTVQTRSMLRQAFAEGIRMVLVINKLDLLISTLQLTPEEAYNRLNNIIQDCNVTLSAYVNVLTIAQTHDHVLRLNPIPEDEHWFYPARGNVVFASGIDGYGFTLDHMARTWVATGKLGSITVDELNAALWGPHWLDAKTMSILPKPKKEGQTPMAVAFLFDPLWSVYSAFEEENFDVTRASKITQRLNIPDQVWRTGKRAPHERMTAVLGAWLPLAKCLLDAVCTNLPSVVAGQQQRLPHMVPKWQSTPADLQDALLEARADGPVVAYVTKLLDTEYMAGTCVYGARSDKAFDEAFVGFARVFSGTLRKGMELTLRSDGGVDTVVPIGQLFLLRGQGLEAVDTVPPGRLCGISGIASLVTKTAVLTSDTRLPPIEPPRLTSASIVQYVIRPKKPADLDKLLLGLRRLYQTDPQVELAVLPTGEYVMGVAGEVHGERCVEDLTTTFAKVEFHISPPIVQYRETVVGSAKRLQYVEATTPDGLLTVEVAAVPMPVDMLAALSSASNTSRDPALLNRVRREVLPTCPEARKRHWRLVRDAAPLVVGPAKYDFTGCLLYDAREQEDDDEDDEEAAEDRARSMALFREAIVSGFQLATGAGPMAEEPMFGICFFLTAVDIELDQIPDHATLANLNRHALSTMANACRLAFQEHTTGQRLVEPLYDFVVHSAGATQGKIYNLLNRRRATIEDEVMAEGGETFFITGQLPVGESFGLQDDLRIATSGAATAQLSLAQWRVLDVDPYFKPTTKEEIEDHGTDIAAPNLAQTIIERVRNRKGIQRRNVVEFAEKQKFSLRGA